MAGQVANHRCEYGRNGRHVSIGGNRLASYLERIAFHGTARPDLKTLRELQQAHVYAVPFENLDVQLRRPVGLDLRSLPAQDAGTQ